MVQIGKSVPDTELDRRLSNIAYNQGCMLVYTSGTTGNPKGVMLSHDAVTFSARVLGKHTGMGRNTKEIQVQYMPANHVGAAGGIGCFKKVFSIKKQYTYLIILY